MTAARWERSDKRTAFPLEIHRRLRLAGGQARGAADRGMKQDMRFERILRLLEGSSAAGRIAGNRARIESALRAKPRRVWPLATVARLFGISPSLLRKWVGQGLLSRFRRPTAHHRPGLTERAVRRFLRELAGEAESGTPVFLHRPRPAEKRCREAVVAQFGEPGV